MLHILIGFGITAITGVGAFWYIKYKYRNFLEQRQLEMFIETLVWDPDDGKWRVDDTSPVKEMKTFYESAFPD